MMHARQRLWFLVLGGALAVVAAVLMMRGLQDSVSYYRTPSDVLQGIALNARDFAPGKVFRLGGFVKPGTLLVLDDGVTQEFLVADNAAEIRVRFKGIPPALFREGQGVVATGALSSRDSQEKKNKSESESESADVFVATDLLAKHDENYMPPALARQLEQQPPHDGSARGYSPSQKSAPPAEDRP